MPERNGFTLVELLVVITIIVILLTLLTPALDRAVYEAELTTCAAQERAMVAGVSAYAAGGRRAYPNPSGGRLAGHQVEQLGAWLQPQNFLLPLMEPYMSRNIFNCPLIGGLSYDLKDNDNGPASKPTQIFSTYGLWFAMRFSDAAGKGIGAKGRYKLGDTLEYLADAADLNSRRLRIGVVVGDLNAINTTETSFSTHQDLNLVYTNKPIQDTLNPTAATYVTYSRWVDGAAAAPIRGKLDLNFAYDDGHVQRFSGLGFKDEERTYPTPHHATGANGDWQEYIPE